jgi:tRNA (cytidine/uridine-2'-O-)-methyltransferase
MQIALFQPDIPQNTGTILRLCACLGAAAHIIEPAGFPISDRHFRRAGMDYLDHVSLTRHDSWSKFEQWRQDTSHRLVLFTTKAANSYLDYRYQTADILLFGRESAGVTDEVVAAADARLLIPIKPGLRSLNVAMAAAMALGEALRQTGSAATSGAAASRTAPLPFAGFATPISSAPTAPWEAATPPRTYSPTPSLRNGPARTPAATSS